jgi:DNA-binding IclR family transcriptional regulator
MAWEDGEVTSGLSSVAVAVLDPTGYPVAAVASTYPADGSGASAVGHYPAVARTAAELTRRLRGS